MKILNFGSLNIDYVYNVKHFVSAGETLSSDKMQKFCGGKGMNQSIALRRAGTMVYHAGCIGEDGGFLRDELMASDVNVENIVTVREATGHAIIQVDRNGQNCILLYGGANQRITKNQIDNTLANFGEGDYLLLQNEINELEYIITRAYEQRMNIVLNPSPCNDIINQLPLEKVSCFILNEVEGKELTGENDSDCILKVLKQKYPNSKIVLTLGSDGVVYFDGENTYRQGIFPVEVVDTTAAGETFTGYFLHGLTQNVESQALIKISCAASALAVSRMGATASIPKYDEVEAFIKSRL